MLPIETVPSSASGFSFPTAGIFYSMVRNGLPSGVRKISVLNVIGLLLLALVSEPSLPQGEESRRDPEMTMP